MRHGPAFCCDDSMNEDWSYCPSCGEAIDWPQDPKEVAERQAAHQLRMETDPAYKNLHESSKRLTDAMFGLHLKAFLDYSEPIVHREAL